MADYNAKMAALEKDQHKIATYTQYWNYGADQHFAVLKWTADLTWHWDSTKQQVVVTNVKITYTRGNPNYKGGGFWDAYVLMNPNMSVPEEGGAFTEPAPDLPGIDGNKLWQTIGTSQSGIFAFFAQNNKTYEYSIDYNLTSTVPYNAVNLGNGKYELLKSVMRQNTGTRPTKSVVWRETGVNVDIDLPVKPTLKTTEAHYHYNVVFLTKKGIQLGRLFLRFP